ncbi:adenylyl-sulfate kinase [Lentzea flaviverrucosa]|uniref:Adenylyl-sulfate kinase n=1 Tax=Lentzea flaviverrucosa TaxID=200379 RepID=A0A1H9XTT5_9PSEU|nr:adenylyl-sulfate kinase [Lentzea flaviverrucosa]RDI19183.1 bifunctional enzyme CysN/CysC [Lentzea flaviverrucosa]SES49459.1 bifunctional enzyme CysN/CysC [Lentzea flaviverrucosa]
MELLRFITCGSVDDGKSTLIGRLLYESKLLYADHLAALEADSRRVGTRGGELDFALLVDGLAAEREQGITIDVAYRFFATEARRFIVADTPGHEQYTRNMVTGASTAEAAVLLLDARKGVLSQTRRHARIVSLLGIRHVALAVNKLDLAGYSRELFEEVSASFAEFAADLDLEEITCVPMSATEGVNVVGRSELTPWYDGPTLLQWLELVTPSARRDVSSRSSDTRRDGPSRFLVQWVNRPDATFRGLSGRVLGGTLRRDETVRLGNRTTSVARIVTMDGDLDEAPAGSSVTVVLADDVDASRGDVLGAAQDPPGIADSFQARLVWLHENGLLPGRQYLAKIGARTVGFTATKALGLNEIGVDNVHFDAPVPFEGYRANRDLGSFVVLDRLSNATVGAGMIDFALSPSNVRWQTLTVDKQARIARNGHRPCVVWLTGLSGAGKSTIADLVEKALHAEGRHTFLLDGDNVRHGLNSDLGFTDADRVENIRRIAEVAALMVDAGLIVLVSFISPFRAERALARELVGENEFCEVFVDTPLAVAEQRDPKGLYRKARRGELANFTGIDSPYEPPAEPEVRLDTTTLSAQAAADAVVARLRALGVC